MLKLQLVTLNTKLLKFLKPVTDDTGTTGDNTAAGDDSIVTLSIPKALQAKHPELISLIRESESMNNKERQYWINIMPVMTEPQLNNLQQILRTERKELDAIDKKYAGQIDEKKKSDVYV